MAVVTFVCWCPCLWWLQSEGGYAAVAANHRQYLTGFAGWPSSLLRQAANLRHFDGWTTAVGLFFAVIAAGWRVPSIRAKGQGAAARVGNLGSVALATLLTSLAVWTGSALLLLLLGLYGIVDSLLGQPGQPKNGDGNAEHTLRLGIILAWVAGLCLVTPLYHPYPRLTLPWLCGTWIAAGLGANRLTRIWIRSGRNKHNVLRAAVCLAIAALLFSWGGVRLGERGIPAWRPRTGLSSIASSVRETIQHDVAAWTPSADALVFVYGEPGLFYQLRAAAQMAAVPIADLNVVTSFGAPGTSAYLVAGPHAQRSREFTMQLAQHRGRFEKIAAFDYAASDLVLLNQHHPRELAAANSGAASEVRLYRVK